ncbi:hypothetical protein [Sorangium cellulosum]|uniref:hypothetical protein n=1 Tax=Sorangium cellulosum TaxID=56 RepID=UPI003D9A4058
MAIDAEVARWCARPIDAGHPGLTLTPLVLGPEGVPVVTDAEQASAAPEVVVLSAMAHGQSEAAEASGVAFLALAAGLDEERRALYGDLVLSSLNAAARRTLEAIMKSGYEFQSEFARSYVAKGRRQGLLEAKANDVLAFLDARGLEVPAEVRARVPASTDLADNAPPGPTTQLIATLAGRKPSQLTGPWRADVDELVRPAGAQPALATSLPFG